MHSAAVITTSVSDVSSNNSTISPTNSTTTRAVPIPVNFLEETSVYRNLERASSLFYYVYIQIGICLPGDCSREDVGNISRQSK